MTFKNNLGSSKDSGNSKLAQKMLLDIFKPLCHA